MYIDTNGCMDMHPIHLRRDTSNLSVDVFARVWYNDCIKEKEEKQIKNGKFIGILIIPVRELAKLIFVKNMILNFVWELWLS